MGLGGNSSFLAARRLASCWNSGGKVQRGGPWAQKEPQEGHGTPAVADWQQCVAPISSGETNTTQTLTEGHSSDSLANILQDRRHGVQSETETLSTWGTQPLDVAPWAILAQNGDVHGKTGEIGQGR